MLNNSIHISVRHLNSVRFKFTFLLHNFRLWKGRKCFILTILLQFLNVILKNRLLNHPNIQQRLPFHFILADNSFRISSLHLNSVEFKFTTDYLTFSFVARNLDRAHSRATHISVHNSVWLFCVNSETHGGMRHEYGVVTAYRRPQRSNLESA